MKGVKRNEHKTMPSCYGKIWAWKIYIVFEIKSGPWCEKGWRSQTSRLSLDLKVRFYPLTSSYFTVILKWINNNFKNKKEKTWSEEIARVN